MSDIYNELALKDFVAWVRYRNAHGLKIDSDTLEYVADGIEQFLEGKTPWKKPKGNKPKPDLMWEIFYKCFFDENYCYDNLQFSERFTKRHKQEGGLYWIVGEELNLSPDNIESHFRKALAQYKTPVGEADFMQWLKRHKGVTMVKITHKKHD